MIMRAWTEVVMLGKKKQKMLSYYVDNMTGYQKNLVDDNHVNGDDQFNIPVTQQPFNGNKLYFTFFIHWQSHNLNLLSHETATSVKY